MADPTSTPAPVAAVATSALEEVVAEYVAAQSATDAAIDAWFIDTFHNRGHGSDEFNRLSAARDALKARLRAL